MTIAPSPRSSLHSRTVVAATPPRGLKPASLAVTIDPVRVLRRHVWLIAASAIVGAMLGTGAFFFLSKVFPQYSTQVLFEVQPGIQTAGQTGIIDTTNDEMVYRIAQTESLMLTSREILDLAMNNPDIKQTEWHKKYIKTSADGNQTFDNAEAVDDLKKEIKAGSIRGSNLFQLSWSARDLRDVPLVLNAISNAYTQTREARDRSVFDRNLTLFRGQSANTERELLDLATQMRTIIRSANITNLDSVHNSAQAIRTMELTKQHAELSSYLNVSMSNLSMVNEQLTGNMEPTSMDRLEAENDRSVVTLIESIQFQQAELRRLKERRMPDDPMVINAQERLVAIEAQRDAKIKEIIMRNLEAKARQSAESVERYRSAVQKLESELDTMQTVLKDLAADQSQYEAMRNRREHLEVKRMADLQLINEVELMRLRADASRVRLAQRALLPREKSFPKPEIIIPLGVLLLLGLTLGVVFLRELLDQRVKSPSDLAVLPGAQVLGSIPDLIDDPTKTPEAELVVHKHPMSVLAESYRQAMSAVQPMLDRNGHQTLLLVGGLPGSGTTTVATNFAAAVAATGRRALLIDANFRRPRLAHVLGVNPDCPGLADVLSQSASIDDVIQQADGVYVMPAGTPAQRVSDRLNTSALDSMIAELRGKFDLVIFDAPPAVVSGDALILANKVDAAVMVVRANQEHRGLVARMIHRLADARCELLGVLLNRPRGLAGGYLMKNYATMAEYTNGVS